MKRILAAAVLSLGMLAATAPDAHAWGCGGGCGPGWFNFGINISGAWGRGAPGGCDTCQTHPALYNAAPYAAGWGFGGSPYDLSGYGYPAPYYGYAAGSGYAPAPGYAPGYAGAPANAAPNAAAGYGAQPAYSPASYGPPAGYGY